MSPPYLTRDQLEHLLVTATQPRVGPMVKDDDAWDLMEYTILMWPTDDAFEN